MKLLDALIQKLSSHSVSTSQSDKYESIANSVSEFNYDPENGIVFDSWFLRYEDMFRVDCSDLDDAAKVRLLLRRLGTREYNKYMNFILPQNPRDISFDDTVNILSKIFGEQSSLFNIRYQCFQISKSPSDDYLTYAGKVNRECERFKLNEITADQFKCLIFICGLKNPEDVDVRTRILARIEQEPSITLQMVTTECQRLLNLKHDTAMVQQKEKFSDFGSINALKSSKTPKHKTASAKQPFGKPPSPCWLCGAWHFVKLCPFKNHKCRQCHRIGHKEGHCQSKKSQSKSGSRNTERHSQLQIKSTFATFKVGFQSKRKFVSLLVNGKPIRLQLDTASDITLISKNTWRKLGCPRIQPTEHVARNALGDIVKLTGEIMCEVQFREHKFIDVCYLTNRHDLDLLGLDWIEKIHPLNELLDEVCSYKPPSESIQNPHISKSNASDVIYSHISQSNAFDVICSHISESNASDVSCSHDISVPNDSYETYSNSKSNTSDVSCSHYISKPNAPDATCSHISKSITPDVSCPHVFSEAENSDPLFSHHDINSVASSKVSSHRIPKSHAFSNVNSAPKPFTFSQTSIASHVTHLRQKHADVFQNKLGCCKFTKAFLSLKQNAKPVFRPKRPVPYAALSVVDQELDRLEALGVIQPVNYSSWAAPIVVVRKANGSIRICADFSTGLNNALEDHTYPLPVQEDLFIKLNGAKYFAKIDLADAYLQTAVDPASQPLLTINTHRGLYQYKRLPSGVKPAPAIFQQIMDTMLANSPGVAVYLDDVIVTGSSKSELFNRLDSVLTKISEYGFYLKEEKCTFFMDSVKYLGFIFDKNGRHPDPENVRAIQNMPPPSNVATLRSFLGLISYYSNFLPQLHRLRAPMNHLLSNNIKWNWSTECQKSFDKVKSLLTSDLLLTYFDPSLEIVVAADASDYGIGAVISHRFPDGKEKAIAHASRTLTPVERRYSQIEKEGLALIFAVKKFHKMLHGRKFTLLTDHKPLLSIFGSKKGIPVYTANRLQRWATMLLGYDFTIKYKATSDFGHADALSRLMSNHKPEDEDTVIASISVEEDVSSMLNNSTQILPMTAARVADHTRRHPTLQQLATFLRRGWPPRLTSQELKQYYQRRQSLSIVNDCIMFADCVIVLNNLRSHVLKQLHTAHSGIGRMKAIARSYVYWPNIDKDIEDLVRGCIKCAAASKHPRKAELHSWSSEKQPWSRIHLDFAGPFQGAYFLVCVDAYSKWPEIFPMHHITLQATTVKLRHLFSRFGVPDVLVTDNGTQFTSSIFSQFCGKFGVKHVRAPPYHPQSNGQAERFVDTFKRALLKAKGEGKIKEILDDFLLIYRTTPNPSAPNHLSPAEIMFGRKVKTTLDAIKPKQIDKGRRNRKMETQFNRHHGTRRRVFQINQKVYVRDFRYSPPQWTSGRILKRRGSVMYVVDVEGLKWVRYANHILEHAAACHETERLNTLWEIFLDSFDMENVATQRNAQLEQNPVRRSMRKRRRPEILQVDPKRRAYVSEDRYQ
uniref:Gag-Pol polyprotein n=1 Tax=Schistosoma japonicum TaxID=6182 RepID=C7C202_SCHJA|nr:Gag-Pol polyprotein [Schistosoma japonicum]